MAEQKAFQKLTYPLPAYNFRVTVDGISMSFSEVSGINLEHETLTYRHGFSFWEGERIRSYKLDKYVPITLKRGTVHGISFLYDWLKEQSEGARALDVSLCDEQGQPVVTWHVAKAVPIKLAVPSFRADSNDLSIESLELMGAGISLEHH
ncbi:MAG: phage tail protein [Gammaproteobacteria bacterium]|nr:phage tail protein [Gammaproteobacteria bacterium]